MFIMLLLVEQNFSEIDQNFDSDPQFGMIDKIKTSLYQMLHHFKKNHKDRYYFLKPSTQI